MVRRAQWRDDDDAMSAQVKTGLLTAMLFLGFVSVFAVISNPDGDNATLGTLALHHDNNGCHGGFLIAGASPGLEYRHLIIERIGGSGDYLIGFGPRTTVNDAWAGLGLKGVVTPGERIEVWTATAAAKFEVRAADQGALAAPVTVSVGGVDVTVPLTSLTVPAEFTTGLPTVHGTATDAGCSGLARVDVTILDAESGLYWNGEAFASPGPHALAAELVRAGALRSPWSLDTTGVAWEIGRSYAFVATAVDGAGNSVATPPASMTLVG